MKPRLLNPPKITFGVTEACPLQCRHCYADCSSSPKAGELDAEEWLRVADEVIADGVIQIYFEGGEPLAKPGILGLLAHCGRDAMTLLRTHGTLVDEATADALAAARLRARTVDLMGPDAASHDAFTGTPGSFDAACAGIRHCVERGLATDVLTILTRQTAPLLNGIETARLGSRREQTGRAEALPARPGQADLERDRIVDGRADGSDPCVGAAPRGSGHAVLVSARQELLLAGCGD